jgi:tetratricopeptide (TPR) repeat protein
LRRCADARAYLIAAIRLKPDFAEAYNNLGAVSHAEGLIAEAIDSYQRALMLDPRSADAEYNLGRALASRGESEAALQHYERSLAIKPDAVTLASAASLLAARNEIVAAVGRYRGALELNPDLPAALVDLAWILATDEHAGVRDPAEAIGLAERVDRLTGHNSPTVLDTLAVAYAAAGQLSRAIPVAERAAVLADAAGADELGGRIRMRLETYRSTVQSPRPR